MFSTTIIVSSKHFHEANIFKNYFFTVKSTVVPEESRATIYNLFRVPLNAVVLGVLLTDLTVARA